MKLRTRVAVLTASAAAVAVVLVSVSAWFVARSQMRASVDEQLQERAEFVNNFPSGGREPGGARGGRPGFLQGGAVEQRFGRDGVVISVGEFEIPVSEQDKAVARGENDQVFHDVTVDDVHFRVLTFSLDSNPGVAVTFAAPLSQVDDSLDRLRGALIVLSALGIVGAAGIGLVVARRSLRPVERLTSAAEHVAATQDFDSEIPVERPDELGSLAESFNRMLGALSTSRDQQHRLVTDASHELRTPLTSLRTNVELLQRAGDAEPELRSQVMDDVVFELDELTALVTELVELATDRHDSGDAEPTNLGSVAEAVVERHRRRSDATINISADDSMVLAVPALLERAVSNLVDNAVKFSADGRVEVVVAEGSVEVSDDGPGIPESDLDQVFERFWRADTARTMPGSGLGLSIVKQVATAHGGDVTASASVSGGARFVLRFPEVD